MEPNTAKWNETESNETEQSRAGPNWAKQSRVVPNGAEWNRTEPSAVCSVLRCSIPSAPRDKTEPRGTEQSRARPNLAEWKWQGRAEQNIDHGTKLSRVEPSNSNRAVRIPTEQSRVHVNEAQYITEQDL